MSKVIVRPKKFNEADEEAASKKAIKDLIELNWGEDEDHQNTALQLLKGLVYANTKTADAFLQDISDYTSKMKVEDFAEGAPSKKKLKEMGAEQLKDKIADLGFQLYDSLNNEKKFFVEFGDAIARTLGNMEGSIDSDLNQFEMAVKLCKEIKRQSEVYEG